jgi:hypothetical protein
MHCSIPCRPPGRWLLWMAGFDCCRYMNKKYYTPFHLSKPLWLWLVLYHSSLFATTFLHGSLLLSPVIIQWKFLLLFNSCSLRSPKSSSCRSRGLIELAHILLTVDTLTWECLFTYLPSLDVRASQLTCLIFKSNCFFHWRNRSSRCLLNGNSMIKLLLKPEAKHEKYSPTRPGTLTKVITIAQFHHVHGTESFQRGVTMGIMR